VPVAAKPVPAQATPTLVTAQSPCKAIYPVTTVIDGSWFGDGSGLSGAPGIKRYPPVLVVGLDDPSLYARFSDVVTIPLAAPFFAQDVKLDELCSDSGHEPGTIEVECVVGPKLSRVVVRPSGDGLDVSVDGGAPQHWNMKFEAELYEGACYELHGLGVRRDLEPARAAWGRDEPSARCGSTPRTRITHVAIDLLAPPGYKPAPGSQLVPLNDVIVSMPGWRMGLGQISNLYGGLHVIRYTDVEAVMISATDMGSEWREAYRLGDRLYVVEKDRITSTELPCGAKAVFEVHYHQDSFSETKGRMRN